MNQSAPEFRVLNFLTTIMAKVESWRLREKSSMEFACIDTHTLNDIDISNAQRFIAVNKLFREK